MSADPPTPRLAPATAGEPGGLVLTPAQARRAVVLLDAAARYWGPGQPGRAGRARALAHALTHHPAAGLDAAQARALPHLLRDGARCPDHAGDPGWLLDGFALAAHLEHTARQRAPGRGPAPPARRSPPPEPPGPRSTPMTDDPTSYCAAPACDRNLAGWAHAPGDCDAPTWAPTLTAAQVAALPADQRPWVRGAARAFALLNPAAGLLDDLGVIEPTPARVRDRARAQETTAVLGARVEAGLHAETTTPDPTRRQAAVTDRARLARLHALDRARLLAALDQRPAGTPDLSNRSILDRRFETWLLGDHPAAVAERLRRRAAYLDETFRRHEQLAGWLARTAAHPPRSGDGDRFDANLRALAASVAPLLDRDLPRLEAELGERDPARVARLRREWEAGQPVGRRYPARYQGAAAARQPIPPDRAHAARSGARARDRHDPTEADRGR
jgi:hypothetical protein